MVLFNNCYYKPLLTCSAKLFLWPREIYCIYVHKLWNPRLCCVNTSMSTVVMWGQWWSEQTALGRSRSWCWAFLGTNPSWARFQATTGTIIFITAMPL